MSSAGGPPFRIAHLAPPRRLPAQRERSPSRVEACVVGSPPIAWPPSSRPSSKDTRWVILCPTRRSRCRTSTRSSTTASLRSWWTCTLPACLNSNPPRGRPLQTTSILSRRRRESEWSNGHIPNATHIEGLQDFSGDAVPSQLLGCTACNIVLYCNSGVRSKRAANKLASLGFTGGIYDGLGIQQWQARLRACMHMLETRPVPSSHRGCPHHGRAPATRPCTHRPETTPPARKPQGSAVGSGRRSRASRPTCPTARRRRALLLVPVLA